MRFNASNNRVPAAALFHLPLEKNHQVLSLFLVLLETDWKAPEAYKSTRAGITGIDW